MNLIKYFANSKLSLISKLKKTYQALHRCIIFLKHQRWLLSKLQHTEKYDLI